MKLSVITPVGPGHAGLARRCNASVKHAIEHSMGVFDRVEHVFIEDHQGQLGRSAARNKGILQVNSDWLFFLDADDEMEQDALTLCDVSHAATFGAVKLTVFGTRDNVYPCDLDYIKHFGAFGTLSMGFFCNTGVASKLLFNESLDKGEDFDFYLRLPNWIKIQEPLVTIGDDQPSAGGPRGYRSIDWLAICQERIDHYLGRNAVLEAA